MELWALFQQITDQYGLLIGVLVVYFLQTMIVRSPQAFVAPEATSTVVAPANRSTNEVNKAMVALIDRAYEGMAQTQSSFLAAVQEENRRLRQDVDTLNSKVADMALAREEERSISSIERNKLNSEVLDLSSSMRKLQTSLANENVRLEAALRERDSMRDDNTDLRENITQLQKSLTQKDQEISEMRDEIRELRQEIETLRKAS